MKESLKNKYMNEQCIITIHMFSQKPFPNLGILKKQIFNTTIPPSRLLQIPLFSLHQHKHQQLYHYPN